MDKRIVQINEIAIAVVSSNEPIITDAQSALDLMMTIKYYDNTIRIAINKQAIAEDFFNLGTGVAGEILQKFSNYQMKIAIFGDFSVYTSKPLKDFIGECNRGNHIFFADDEDSAINKLAGIL